MLSDTHKILNAYLIKYIMTPQNSKKKKKKRGCPKTRKFILQCSKPSIGKNDGWMDVFQFYAFFNSISII